MIAQSRKTKFFHEKVLAPNLVIKNYFNPVSAQVIIPRLRILFQNPNLWHLILDQLYCMLYCKNLFKLPEENEVKDDNVALRRVEYKLCGNAVENITR